MGRQLVLERDTPRTSKGPLVWLRRTRERQKQKQREKDISSVLHRINLRVEEPPVFDDYEETFRFSHRFRSIPAAVKLALENLRDNPLFKVWVVGIGEKAHSAEGQSAILEHERVADIIEELGKGIPYCILVSEYHLRIIEMARRKLPLRYLDKIHFEHGDAALLTPARKIDLALALDVGRNPEDTDFALPLADRIYEALEDGGIVIANGQALQMCLTAKGLFPIGSQIEQSEGHGSIVYFYRKPPTSKQK